MAWADKDYKFKKKITIDHTKVAGDETDFPVLISVTDTDLKDIANGGGVYSSSGYDIVFYNNTESTKLNHEIDSYTNTSGKIEFWVCADISSTSNTIIWLYYGKKGVTSDPSSTSTWDSNFLAVWHLTVLTDSTGNGYTLTNSNATTDSSGKIGGCYDFVDDNSAHLQHATLLDVGFPAALTVEAWVKRDDANSKPGIVWKENVDVQDRFVLQPRNDADSNDLYFWYEGQNQGTELADSGVPITGGDTTWFYCIGVYEDNSPCKVYANKTTVTSSSGNDATIQDGTHANFEIGLFDVTYFDGNIDEVRLSNSARTANWLATSYETSNDPSTFLSLGAQINFHVPLKINKTSRDWADPLYKYKKKITIDNTKVSGDETDFPIAVNITDANLADTSNGGFVYSSSGYDICFYDGTETTLLSHEIEMYINTTGQILYWVKIPSLSSTKDTIIYMYYGKKGVTIDPSSTDTWHSDYKGVWHCDDESGGLTDSTSNGNDGTEIGNPTYRQTDYKGYSVALDGNDGWTLPDNIEQGTPCTEYTWMAIVKFDDYNAQYRIIDFMPHSTASQKMFGYVAQYNNTRDQIEANMFDSGDAGTGTQAAFESSPSDTTNFRFLITTYDKALAGNEIVVHLNSSGVADNATVDDIEYVFGSEYGNAICTKYDGGGGNSLPGDVCEVRFSTEAFSTNYIGTLIETIANHATFLSVSSQINFGVQVKINKTSKKWVDLSYGYKKKIVIDHTKVSGDETDFPILLSITDSDLADTANGGRVENSSGYDICFYNDTETTKLNHEIEKYTNTTGELIYWICTDISSTSNTIIWMYYGKTGITSDPSSTSTWDSNYIAIWHMNGATDSQVVDSKGTYNSSTHKCNSISGKISDARDFVSTDSDQISFGDMTEPCDGSLATLTVEAWVNIDDDTQRNFIISKYDGEDDTQRRYMIYHVDQGLLRAWVGGSDSANAWAWTTDNDVITSGAWTYVVYSFNCATETATFYVNDSAEAASKTTDNGTGPTVFEAGTQSELSGVYDKNGPDEHSDESLEELRMSKIQRGADWLLTTYNSQNSPSTFLSVGSQLKFGRQIKLIRYVN